MGKPEPVAPLGKTKTYPVAVVMATGVTLSELFLWAVVSLELGLPVGDDFRFCLDLALANLLVPMIAGDRFFQARDVSRTTRSAWRRDFLFATGVITCILTVAGMVGSGIICRRLDRPSSDFSALVFGVALASFLFGFFAAERLCQARGLSPSGNSIETWDRMVADRERFVAPFLAVEYAFNRPTVIVNVCLSALVCLLSAVLVVCRDTVDFLTSVTAIVSFVLFGGLGMQPVLAWDGCQMRIDHEGVYGYPARLAFFRKLVPWTEIASCDIVTRRDASGRIYLVVPVFRNVLGEKLMSLSLLSVPMDYQERVVRYIKMKLPKARDRVDEL